MCVLSFLFLVGGRCGRGDYSVEGREPSQNNDYIEVLDVICLRS